LALTSLTIRADPITPLEISDDNRSENETAERAGGFKAFSGDLRD